MSPSPADALTALLPQSTDSDRPWLVWYAPGERVELTGHVLAMWAAKTAGLLSAEVGDGAQIEIAMEPGWRALTWYLGTWLAGGTVVATAPTGGQNIRPQDDVPIQASIAYTPEDLNDDAEFHILVPQAPLAVRWEGPNGDPLPPLALDGVADVMTYADHFAAVPSKGDDPALVMTDRNRPNSLGTVLRLSRDEIAEEASARAMSLSHEARDRESREHTPPARACLIQQEHTGLAVLGVLAAWKAGVTAVLVSPRADESLIAIAARQEGLSAQLSG